MKRTVRFHSNISFKVTETKVYKVTKINIAIFKYGIIRKNQTIQENESNSTMADQNLYSLYDNLVAIKYDYPTGK